MRFNELRLSGVFVIEPEKLGDERGYFMRAYDKKLFREHGVHRDWVQENESFSAQKGTVRGLHFQEPNAEGKLVRVLSGAAFFAFVDIREQSPTFEKCDAITLSSENKKMLYVPRGFALGMCTLEDNTVLYYKMDNWYAPQSARAVRWNDPYFDIIWPVKIPVVISERDCHAQFWHDYKRKHRS